MNRWIKETERRIDKFIRCEKGNSGYSEIGLYLMANAVLTTLQFIFVRMPTSVEVKLSIAVAMFEFYFGLFEIRLPNKYAIWNSIHTQNIGME